MNVSILCITKDRPEFLPWLKWDIEKQTYDGHREVIVVDSSKESNKAWFAYHMPYARLIELPNHYVCGHARQAALDASTGDVIAWFDDDDWHHPDHLKACVGGLQGGAHISVVTAKDRLILKTMTLFTFEESILCHTPFFVCRAEDAKRYDFEPLLLGEDVPWMEQVAGDAFHEPGAVFIPKWNLPSFLLIHHKNTWNSPDKHEYTFYLEFTGKPLPKKPPEGVSEQVWRETWEHLGRLR